MENQNSQNSGGENLPAAGEAIFSTAPVTPAETAPDRFIPNNAQGIGAAALEGLPLPEASATPGEAAPDTPPDDDSADPDIAQIIREGGEISAEAPIGGTKLTSDGLKQVREADQRAASAHFSREEYKSAEETYQEDRNKVLTALGHYGLGGDA